MYLNDEGMIINAKQDHRATGIHASQKKGRWQYRIDNKKGKLIASGMLPHEFVKDYWFRDDFTY